MSISVDRLTKAIGRVQSSCGEQVRSGSQTETLDDEYAACGQFLGETQNAQRGLHGTAAAIEMLSASSEDDRQELLERLVKFVIDRDKADPPSDNRKRTSDKANIIKTSELLAAMSELPASLQVQGLSDFRSSLVQLLSETKQADGWPYFKDGGQADLLPTVHALRALDLANEKQG